MQALLTEKDFLEHQVKMIACLSSWEPTGVWCSFFWADLLRQKYYHMR